jgi:hypothetical protein
LLKLARWITNLTRPHIILTVWLPIICTLVTDFRPIERSITAILGNTITECAICAADLTTLRVISTLVCDIVAIITLLGAYLNIVTTDCATH